MALFKTDAVVIGRRALGESDRLVDFYTRDFGKVRGVAKAARRPRSRFGSALETFTLGRLVFFDTGRSALVRVDHFDILHPFVGVRERLDRLGRGAWVVECLARLSADRDPHPALYGLLVRSLRALEGRTPGDRVALCFAVRAVDLLGHRPRVDRCVRCGRPHPSAPVGLDVGEGGLVCGACGPGADSIPLGPSAVGALVRLRGLRWDEALRLPLPASLDGELTLVLEGVLARLMGQVPRSSRFMTQTRHAVLPAAPPASVSPRSV
jgi:DNA repair protein RecO (recombination protein O)